MAGEELCEMCTGASVVESAASGVHAPVLHIVVWSPSGSTLTGSLVTIPLMGGGGGGTCGPDDGDGPGVADGQGVV